MIRKKRRQHYVFQAYLDAWTEKNQLWCKRSDCEPFKTTTLNVAQERDFYRIKPLNVHEEQFLKNILPKMSKEAEMAFFEHIDNYLSPLKYEIMIRNFKQLFEIEFGNNIPEDIEKMLSQLDELIDIMINNVEEDYYSDIEGEAIIWINLLKKRDADFYYINNNDIKENNFYNDIKFDFLFAICTQYFRTKAIKERWILSLEDFLDDPRTSALGIKKNDICLENLTHHFFWYVKNACAYKMREKDAYLTVLINETNIPFVTSDQPVINLKADYKNLSEEVSDLVFFYPIAPDIAITINDNTHGKNIFVTENQVDDYNRAIIAASYQNVFYSNADIYERYQHLLN